MKRGIELLTDRIDRAHALSLEKRRQLLFNQLHTLDPRRALLLFRHTRERTVQVIDRRKQLSQNGARRQASRTQPILLDPAAKVLVISAAPLELIEVLIPFSQRPLQRL